MIKTFPNLNQYTMSEFTFIAGSYKELMFFVKNPAGNPVDISYQTILCTLYPYLNPTYVAFQKYGTGSNGLAKVMLYSSDTRALSGKYIIHVSMNSELNYSYLIGRGIVNIIPAIGGAS